MSPTRRADSEHEFPVHLIQLNARNLRSVSDLYWGEP